MPIAEWQRAPMDIESRGAIFQENAGRNSDLVEIATAQKESAGLADDFAARLVHAGAAGRAMT
jgi:hypothetical protein